MRGRVAERIDKKKQMERMRDREREKAKLPLSSSPRSPFLLNQIFPTDRSGLLSSPLPLHPSFSISSLSIHHRPHCYSPSPSCFSLHIPLLLPPSSSPSPSLSPSPSFLGRCRCSSHGNHWIHVCLIRMPSINNPAGWR